MERGEEKEGEGVFHRQSTAVNSAIACYSPVDSCSFLEH